MIAGVTLLVYFKMHVDIGLTRTLQALPHHKSNLCHQQ